MPVSTFTRIRDQHRAARAESVPTAAMRCSSGAWCSLVVTNDDGLRRPRRRGEDPAGRA